MTARWLRRFCGFVILVLLIGAPLPSAAQGRFDSSYLSSPNRIERALAGFAEKAGGAPRIAQIEIEPRTIVLLAEAPGTAGQLQQWTITRFSYFFFQRDTVSGPQPYMADFGGDPSGALFRIQDLQFAALPTMIQKAIDYAQLGGTTRLTSISIRRHMMLEPEPAFGDIQWRISLASETQTATIYFDNQARIVGDDLPNTAVGTQTEQTRPQP